MVLYIAQNVVSSSLHYCAFRVAGARLRPVSLQLGQCYCGHGIWGQSAGCLHWVWDTGSWSTTTVVEGCNGWGWSRAHEPMWCCWEAINMSPLLLQGSPEVQVPARAGARFSSANTSAASNLPQGCGVGATPLPHLCSLGMSLGHSGWGTGVEPFLSFPSFYLSYKFHHPQAYHLDLPGVLVC